MTRNVTVALLVLLITGLVGCGGGQRESGPRIDPQAGDVLRAAGLAIIYESSKDTYQRGETVHLCLSIRNDSSRVHTVAVHSTGEGLPTHYTAIYGDDPYQTTWRQRDYDTPSWQIQPGQTANLVDVEWDQSTISGGPADPGYYEACLEIYLVWLDGRQASPLPLALGRSITIE